jgi:DNA-binding CsgD family transcriptional regulator
VAIDATSVFVGREGELRALRDAFAAASGGRSQVVLVDGEAGQEVAVARLVVAGMTNREVSEQLMLSTKTVEFHLSHVYAKLGVRTRSELRARARANELAL